VNWPLGGGDRLADPAGSFSAAAAAVGRVGRAAGSLTPPPARPRRCPSPVVKSAQTFQSSLDGASTCPRGGTVHRPGAGGLRACVSNGESGSFCGVQCKDAQDCPAGYGCKPGVNIEGGATMQCVPLTGECKCSKAAIASGKKTLCAQTLATGSGKPVVCKGERKCTTAGLAVCTASAATVETCDGLDNDCDGDTDDAACDDKNPCTDDLCNAGQAGINQACTQKTKTATPL
jgi:hypothetical protein